MRKVLIVCICTLCAVMFTSCRNAAERQMRKIHFEGIENVRMESLTGMVIDLAVENGTAYKLRADEAKIRLCYKGSEVASLELKEPVEVARRSHGTVETRWAADLRNPLAMLTVVAHIAREQFDDLTVDLAVEGSGGPMPVNISRKGVPFSNFLNTFGIEPNFLISILQQKL
ncbi:MAG: hypothetical protein IKZ12_05105 [Alistipes sp.]|nr:hypothetical protein [Alistipes sp.]